MNKENSLIKFSDLGLTKAVKLLIDKGADIHVEDDYALRWASYDGHLEVVKYLKSKGVK